MRPRYARRRLSLQAMSSSRPCRRTICSAPRRLKSRGTMSRRPPWYRALTDTLAPLGGNRRLDIARHIPVTRKNVGYINRHDVLERLLDRARDRPRYFDKERIPGQRVLIFRHHGRPW